MAYFQSDFLSRRREDWLRQLHSVEVLVGSTWYAGTISQKKVDGDSIIIMATFPQLDDSSVTITASRIKDIRGEVAAYQAKSIKKAAGQGTLIKISIPVREI